MSDQSALLNNQRLFDEYAKKLCSYDVDAFVEVAEKLATWLDNPKAYYEEARHEIIKLLMIALSTVRRAVGAMDLAERFHVSRYTEQPLVPPYAKLVQVVRQYVNLFVEPDLAVQVRYLVSTVNLPPAKDNSQEFRTPASLTEQAPVAASLVAATRDTIPAKAEAGTLALTSPSSESPRMSSANAPISGVPQRIKRKRKTLEQLADVDQRKLRENVASMQASLAPKEFKVPIGSGELTNIISHANADSQPVGAFRPAPPEVSSSPVSMDAIGAHSTPSRPPSVDRKIATDGENIISTTARQPQVEEHSGENQVVTNVTTADVTQLAFPNSKCTLSRDEAATKSVRAETIASSEPVCRDGAVGGDSMNVEIIDKQLANGRTVSDGDKMELEHESPMQDKVVEKLQEIHDRLSQYASQMPLPYGDLSPTISKSFDQEEAVSENTKTVDRQVDSPGARSGHPKVEISSHTEETTHQGKKCVSGPDVNASFFVHPSLLRVKVPTLVRGLSNPGKVTIRFEIKHSIHAALSHWTRPDTERTEFVDAICITLGCYQATEAALKVVAGKSGRDWRGFVSSHQSSWPETGGLQLSSTAGNCCSLPLSPPFVVTPDNLFDLSHLLILGINEFELQFSQDMSKYLLALVIHPPTPAQLAGRSERSKREQDWKNWIHDLSRPFHANPVSLFTR